MFRMEMHIQMPFCRCAIPEVTSGIRHEFQRAYQFVECSRCGHREQTPITGMPVIVILDTPKETAPKG